MPDIPLVYIEYDDPEECAVDEIDKIKKINNPPQKLTQAQVDWIIALLT